MKEELIYGGVILVLSIALITCYGYIIATNLSIPRSEGLAFDVELHCITEHYRNGVLISYENHAMSLTTLGKNWIADNLCGALLTNVSLIASYIATSNQSNVFDAAWIVIPTEHLEGSTGLGRANSTYTDTGAGLFNLTHTFTSKGTYSTQTYGLYWDSYANDPNNGLIAAEVQASAKNMVASDTLAVTIMGTIS